MDEGLIGLQEICGERLDVEPQKALPALGFKAEIEIEAVDACDNPRYANNLRVLTIITKGSKCVYGSPGDSIVGPTTPGQKPGVVSFRPLSQRLGSNGHRAPSGGGT